MRFTLYPIYWLSDGLDDEQFDLTRLPFDITENVRIEAVSQRFRAHAFDLGKERLGTGILDELKAVRYGLVHRYEPEPIISEQTGKVLGYKESNESSETLIRQVAACLRLIRPMRQSALLMRGEVRQDGTFDVTGYDVPPLHLIEVPDVQQLFKLRNQDADDLRDYAPAFLQGLRGEFWKFRMAVQFHELGHFQALDWKARYLLWCSAIESIYTSHGWEHQGSLVATSRIEWFIGENTSIYAPGDIPSLLQDPHVTVGQIVPDLYKMRNFMAHGDKIPEPFFQDILRHGLAGDVRKAEVLMEAASFIIRTSLLRILRDGLLNHFTDAGPAEAYFGAQNLTRSALRRAQRVSLRRRLKFLFRAVRALVWGGSP
jgi:hypothetical protein